MAIKFLKLLQEGSEGLDLLSVTPDNQKTSTKVNPKSLVNYGKDHSIIDDIPKYKQELKHRITAISPQLIKVINKKEGKFKRDGSGDLAIIVDMLIELNKQGITSENGAFNTLIQKITKGYNPGQVFVSGEHRNTSGNAGSPNINQKRMEIVLSKIIDIYLAADNPFEEAELLVDVVYIGKFLNSSMIKLVKERLITKYKEETDANRKQELKKLIPAFNDRNSLNRFSDKLGLATKGVR